MFETGKLAKPNEVRVAEAGNIYYAKWMGDIPAPKDADFTDGLVTVKCPQPCGLPHYAIWSHCGGKKYTKKQVNATEYSVTYDADAFAVHGHSLYSKDKLNWKLTYDGKVESCAEHRR